MTMCKGGGDEKEWDWRGSGWERERGARVQCLSRTLSHEVASMNGIRTTNRDLDPSLAHSHTHPRNYRYHHLLCALCVPTSAQPVCVCSCMTEHAAVQQWHSFRELHDHAAEVTE